MYTWPKNMLMYILKNTHANIYIPKPKTVHPNIHANVYTPNLEIPVPRPISFTLETV